MQILNFIHQRSHSLHKGAMFKYNLNAWATYFSMFARLSRIVGKQQVSVVSSAQTFWQFRSFNSWVVAIKRGSSAAEALNLYTRMQQENRPFDSFSILFTIKACAISANLPIIKHLHAHVVKLGFSTHVYVATSLLSAYNFVSFEDACVLFDEMPVRNVVTLNTMITGYLRCGSLEKARQIFDQMHFRDLATWSTMIKGYLDKHIWHEGLQLFREMMMVGELIPDQLTFGPILVSFGRMGSVGLASGKSIHAFAIRNGWELDGEIGTCLVDMYAKGGSLKNACLVFDMMVHRDVVAWTAMICGFEHCGKDALLIFEMMRDCGVRPNELTFTCILTACAQGKLVEEGRRYFKMIELCGLKPTIQHYGCMIDLFGKAGLLGEAYEVIKSMPFQPNFVIWGSFLASCKQHRQYELAERVIERVRTTVRPENDGGVYSLISDLYILNNKWSDAERIRNLMLNHVKKAR